MTMVLNITSHNERALAIESAKYSNDLAGDASRTAFLLAVLADGVSQAEVPRLVKSAKGFVEELRQVDEQTSNGRREPFRALIPVRVVNEAVHDVGGARDLADAVEHALSDSSVDDRVFTDLALRLNRVSERFASQALNAGHASIDA
ncbi:hypothetical protein J2Y46_000952 [Microbacterium sp. BE35]|uniref:hypothetical protein n=1 Tax=Microbacterium sp. BE35 TaxID=2817773 RepID=UPI00285DE798|nr:hypothetical protein [Microbacterium sp. BE35]MDR7188136.1 hypothetical protein [Microbacterium sp. BE35]